MLLLTIIIMGNCLFTTATPWTFANFSIILIQQPFAPKSYSIYIVILCVIISICCQIWSCQPVTKMCHILQAEKVIAWHILYSWELVLNSQCALVFKWPHASDKSCTVWLKCLFFFKSLWSCSRLLFVLPIFCIHTCSDHKMIWGSVARRRCIFNHNGVHLFHCLLTAGAFTAICYIWPEVTDWI